MPQRILVVAPNWIGDALMARPLLAALKARGGAIDVLAPPWVAAVVRRMPEVGQVVEANLRHGALQLGERWHLARRLPRYDLAVVLPHSWKSALIPFFARIPVRVGYRGEARYGLLNKILKPSALPMAAHYAALGGSAEPQPLRVSEAEIQAAMQKFGIAKRYAVLAPGAEYGPAKRWPYFGALAPRLGMPAVILGAASDAPAAQGIPGTNLVGRTTLDEAVRLVAGAEVVVSNDSGLMHVAAALGRPQVALFGSSSPEHTPPASPAARVVWLRLECSPCFARECPLGHFRCMKEITVDRVLAQLP